MSDVAAAKPANGDGKTFFGHPKGLQTLFFTEMWERFSYYGMRAFLVVFISTSTAKGGLGESAATAGIFYALYGSSIYLMSLPGGWIADRYIGQRMAVLVGGIIIMFGHISLAIPTYTSFLIGLGLLVIGTGFLKPNVSTIVGQLYDKQDPRRDAGYTIYYMGINIGAFFAPIVCGFLAQSTWFRTFLADSGFDPNIAWHFGFGAAAIGMFFGVVQFWLGWKHLGAAGAPPVRTEGEKGPSLPMPAWIVAGVGAAVVLAVTLLFFFGTDVSTKDAIKNSFGVGLGVISVCLFVIMYRYVARDADERRRVLAMMVLFLGCLSFFALFEQAGSTLSLFAEHKVHRTLLGLDFPSSYYQFLNAAYVVMLAPVFAAIWLGLAKRGREPTSVTKFAIGMVITAMAFATLLPALLGNIAEGGKVSGLYLFGFYLVSTLSELCISPVGLSTMNKLAPDRLAGFVMGIWFLATAVGYYFAGLAEAEVGSLAKALDLHPTAGLFYLLILFALIIALVLYMLSGPVKRMLAADAAPAASLPKATARKGG